MDARAYEALSEVAETRRAELEWREGMARRRAAEKSGHLDRMAVAVKKALDAGARKADVSRALGPGGSQLVYKLLEREVVN